MKELSKVVQHFGSQAAIARELDLHPMAISHWHKRGVPLKWAIKIERITGGQFKASDLAPRFYS